MAIIYTLANWKGGTAKSTTAGSLGAALAGMGRRVLVIDADPQGGVSFMLGVDPERVDRGTYDLITGKAEIKEVVTPTGIERLDLIPATPALARAEAEMFASGEGARFKDAIKPALRHYDSIILDTGPSIGPLVIYSLAAADTVIVCLQCELPAVRGLKNLMRVIERVKEKDNPGLRVRILRTMVSHTSHSEGIAEQLKQTYPAETFRASIYRTIQISQASLAGIPFVLYAPAHPVAKAYKTLAKEVLGDE